MEVSTAAECCPLKTSILTLQTLSALKLTGDRGNEQTNTATCRRSEGTKEKNGRERSRPVHAGVTRSLRGEQEKRYVGFAQNKSGDKEGFDVIPAHRGVNFRVLGTKCKDQVLGGQRRSSARL